MYTVRCVFSWGSGFPRHIFQYFQSCLDRIWIGEILAQFSKFQYKDFISGMKFIFKFLAGISRQLRHSFIRTVPYRIGLCWGFYTVYMEADFEDILISASTTCRNIVSSEGEKLGFPCSLLTRCLPLGADRGWSPRPARPAWVSGWRRILSTSPPLPTRTLPASSRTRLS